MQLKHVKRPYDKQNHQVKCIKSNFYFEKNTYKKWLFSKMYTDFHPFLPRFSYTCCSHSEIGLSCLTSGGKGLNKLHTPSACSGNLMVFRTITFPSTFAERVQWWPPNSSKTYNFLSSPFPYTWNSKKHIYHSTELWETNKLNNDAIIKLSRKSTYDALVWN